WGWESGCVSIYGGFFNCNIGLKDPLLRAWEDIHTCFKLPFDMVAWVCLEKTRCSVWTPGDGVGRVKQ
ncbi:hypothetical protein KI387_031048, partial [Taxus chinensis]